MDIWLFMKLFEVQIQEIGDYQITRIWAQWMPVFSRTSSELWKVPQSHLIHEWRS